MSLSITQIKSKVTPKLRGTTLNQLSNFNEKCREAADNVLLRCYPLETIRQARIENAIHSRIYSYAVNQDIRGNKGVIDIKPVGLRQNGPEVEGRFSREFDLRRDEDTFAIDIINGTKTLRLSKRVSEHVTVATLDSLTLGDTVTGSGDVQNLDINRYNFISGIGSVQFGLSGATGSGSITIDLGSSINLEEVEDVGALFEWLSFVDASRLTSVQLQWGTDVSNYWSKTVTQPHDRDAFESAAWALLRHDWATATETGTPDAADINFLKVVITYNAGTALANCYLDNVTASVGRPYDIVYYSDRFFKGTDGTYKALPTDDSDVILIANEGHNIFLYELMMIIIQELGQKAVAQNVKWFADQLNGFGDVPGLYYTYNRAYPSQAISKSMTYYNFGAPYESDND